MKPENRYMYQLSSLFQENKERFVAFAYSYTRDWTEAEDIVMESISALWEQRERWDEGKELRPLLLAIVKNKALNYLEKQQTHLRIEESLYTHRLRELSFRISTLKECDPDRLFSEEIGRIVQDALRRLPPQSRQIFLLSRVDNLSNRRIAEQLNLSVKSVEYHITKALRTLRVALKDYLPLLIL
jgi:RNA polymerase sigma-70 factor (ECF subfamily)